VFNFIMGAYRIMCLVHCGVGGHPYLGRKRLLGKSGSNVGLVGIGEQERHCLFDDDAGAGGGCVLWVAGGRELCALGCKRLLVEWGGVPCSSLHPSTSLDLHRSLQVPWTPTSPFNFPTLTQGPSPSHPICLPPHNNFAACNRAANAEGRRPRGGPTQGAGKLDE
jgi:hypothetical protein